MANIDISNHDILKIILVILILFLLSRQSNTKNKCNEEFTSIDADTSNGINNAINTAVTKATKLLYNDDIEAMRNLSAISKSLMTGTNYHEIDISKITRGDLTIPANNTILEGTLKVNGNIEGGSINSGSINSASINSGDINGKNGDIITSNGSITSGGIVTGTNLKIGLNGMTIDINGDITGINDIKFNDGIYSKKLNNMYYHEDAIIYDDMRQLITMNPPVIYPSPTSINIYSIQDWNGRSIYGQGNSYADFAKYISKGLHVVVPANKSVLWVRTPLDRMSSFSLWTLDINMANVNAGLVRTKLLGSYVNGGRFSTLYSPDGANGCGTGNYRAFTWMPIPVPLSTGDKTYMLCTGMPEKDVWRDGWIGGIAFSTNPWNHAMNVGGAYQDDIKANGTITGINNDTHSWNYDHITSISMGIEVRLMVPCINSGKDKLLYYVEHNNNWSGGIITNVYIGSGWFARKLDNFTTTYSNPFATSINSKMYNRFYATRIPSNLLQPYTNFIPIIIVTRGLTGDAIYLREIGTMDLN